MKIDWYHLPSEVLATWNAAWSDGSGGTIHELTSGLKGFVLDQMKTDFQVSTKQLGTWLGRNGWMKERVQKIDRWTKGGQSPRAVVHRLHEIPFEIQHSRIHERRDLR